LLIKENENFNIISNEATKTNHFNSNLKAFSDNKKTSDINFNNNFNFTSTSINNFNHDEIDKFNHQPNYSNPSKFQEISLNKETDNNNQCINNTYNYKTEINIGNNRYDESPSKTLSHILKKYKTNTDKKSKENYRILRELKKYQEDEDYKELELSISNLSISMEKNKISVNNSLNNSKNINNSMKNRSLRSDSRSRSRSIKESFILEKSFESQISDKNNKKSYNLKIETKIINLNEEEINKKETNTIKNTSLTKEKLISVNAISDKIKKKIADKFNNEQNITAKTLSYRISDCSVSDKVEEQDEQDEFYKKFEEKSN
jgi:hypothetical protein